MKGLWSFTLVKQNFLFVRICAMHIGHWLAPTPYVIIPRYRQGFRLFIIQVPLIDDGGSYRKQSTSGILDE